MFFLGYRDAPVEPDTVPLHLLTPAPDVPPHSLVKLLARHADLLQQYEEWPFTLHPKLWKELQTMTHPAARPAEDWKAVVEYIDIKAVAEAFGLEQLIQAFGPEQLAQVVKPEQLIQAFGPERLIELALSKLTPEQQRQLRQRLPAE